MPISKGLHVDNSTVLQQGDKVFLLDFDEEELEYTTKVHLQQFEPRVGSALCNLRDVETIRGKVKQAAEFLGGRIDVLINNGGQNGLENDLLRTL